MIRAGWAVLLAAGLMGCGAVDNMPAQDSARRGAVFTPDGNGLAVAGSSQRIDFGRAPSGVIAVLDRELGRSEALGVSGCPGGIVEQRDWNGLILSFTSERFVGWRKGVAQAGTVCGEVA